MNALVPALAVVTAALIGAIVSLLGLAVQIRGRPSRDEERSREREERITELTEQVESYYDRLRQCETARRELDELLYHERVGHAIAERLLEQSKAREDDLVERINELEAEIARLADDL